MRCAKTRQLPPLPKVPDRHCRGTAPDSVFVFPSCSMHPTTPAPTLLGEVHRGHLAEAAPMIDAEVDRMHGQQRPLLTDGGDPPRPPEVTLRCVRAPRRTEWIPARRVGILRPCAVPVVGGTSRLHKASLHACQPAPNSGHRQPPSADVGPTKVHQWDAFGLPQTLNGGSEGGVVADAELGHPPAFPAGNEMVGDLDVRSESPKRVSPGHHQHSGRGRVPDLLPVDSVLREGFML